MTVVNKISYYGKVLTENFMCECVPHVPNMFYKNKLRCHEKMSVSNIEYFDHRLKIIIKLISRKECSSFRDMTFSFFLKTIDVFV